MREVLVTFLLYAGCALSLFGFGGLFILKFQYYDLSQFGLLYHHSGEIASYLLAVTAGVATTLSTLAISRK